MQNFPTVGLFDGTFRRNLEATGMGYALEVEMIRHARVKGLLPTQYVFNEEEARAMACAGADIVVCHKGLTTGGSIGAESAYTVDDCVARIRRIAEAAVSVNPNVLLLIHGGPIVLPEHVQCLLERCPECHGFYGASSMERLPVEIGIRTQVESFKKIRCAR